MCLGFKWIVSLLFLLQLGLHFCRFKLKRRKNISEDDAFWCVYVIEESKSIGPGRNDERERERKKVKKRKMESN